MSTLLSVPTRGAIQWTTVTRLEEIRDKHPGLAPILYQEGHLNVALTRNHIVQQFLETDHDVLAMVDDDVTPPPHFLDVVEHLDICDMVGIPYPMFAQNVLDFTIFEEVPGGLKLLAPESGLNGCDALGTGCVVIHRRVFEKLGDTPFRMSNDPRDKTITDDFLFCKDMRDAGFTIGYYWDGWYADHCTTVSLAPLKEIMMKEFA